MKIFILCKNDRFAVFKTRIHRPVIIECKITTGIGQVGDVKINVYPNPFSRNVTIDKGESFGVVSLNVYNTLGAKVYSTVLKEQMDIIDLSFLAHGIYFFHLTDRKKSHSQWMIKE